MTTNEVQTPEFALRDMIIAIQDIPEEHKLTSATIGKFSPTSGKAGYYWFINVAYTLGTTKEANSSTFAMRLNHAIRAYTDYMKYEQGEQEASSG